jgi:hypothetical protein
MLSSRLAAVFRPLFRVAPILLACLGPAAALAQELPAPAQSGAANPFGRKYPARVYRTVRLEGKPPVIDGRFDDEAWKQGEWAGDYTQFMPTEGAPPSQPTELKILYDDKHVYFAIRAYDDPSKVHRYPGRRDDFNGYAVDVVGVCFDSYNRVAALAPRRAPAARAGEDQLGSVRFRGWHCGLRHRRPRREGRSHVQLHA